MPSKNCWGNFLYVPIRFGFRFVYDVHKSALSVKIVLYVRQQILPNCRLLSKWIRCNFMKCHKQYHGMAKSKRELYIGNVMCTKINIYLVLATHMS